MQVSLFSRFRDLGVKEEAVVDTIRKAMQDVMDEVIQKVAQSYAMQSRDDISGEMLRELRRRFHSFFFQCHPRVLFKQDFFLSFCGPQHVSQSIVHTSSRRLVLAARAGFVCHSRRRSPQLSQDSLLA